MCNYCVKLTVPMRSMWKNLFHPNLLRKSTPVTNVFSAAKASIQHNLKINRRFFQTTTANFSKLFKESENLYAYSVLQTIPIVESAIFVSKNPKKLIATEQDFNEFLARSWRNSTASEIVEAFKNVSDYCISNGITVADKRFDQLVDGLVDHVEKLTDDELADLLKCLIKFPVCGSHDAHNFHDIWSALDDISLIRMLKWTLEQRFYFAELWYRLNLGRMCDYLYEFTDRLQKNASRLCLTKEQLIHAFFYLNITRKRNVEFEFEYAVERIIDQLTADEMAVVALGFFKTETKIKLQSVIEAMCRKVIEEHDTIHDISLAAILKVIRFSSHIKSPEMIYAVLHHLQSEIPRLSNVTCMHVALLGTNLQVYHENCLSKIVEKLSQDLDKPEKLRLKEIERLLLATTMFDFESKTVPDFYERCLSELKKESRLPEREQHLRCLQSALNYLCIRKVYDFELINAVMDKDHLLKVYGRTPIARELIVLDYSVEIECPDYKGNRLSAKTKNRIIRLNYEYPPTPDYPKHTIANKLFLKVQKAVNTFIGDPNLCLPLHVLPHFTKADLIVCKNIKTNEFVYPNVFDGLSATDVKYPKKDEDLKWYALIILAYNQTVRENRTPLGLMKMKARQLKTIGYEPIFIPWCDVHPKTDAETLQLIRTKLQ